MRGRPPKPKPPRDEFEREQARKREERLAVPVYRTRRGKVVQVPPEWVGHFPTRATKRKRNPVKRRTRSGP